MLFVWACQGNGITIMIRDRSISSTIADWTSIIQFLFVKVARRLDCWWEGV